MFWVIYHADRFAHRHQLRGRRVLCFLLDWRAGMSLGDLIREELARRDRRR